MKLSFVARGDQLVTLPGSPVRHGQYQARVARTWVTDQSGKTVGGYVANAEPFVCDSDSDVGMRLVKLTYRDRSLWPADRATAAACNVPFVELSFADGAWSPKQASKKSSTSQE